MPPGEEPLLIQRPGSQNSDGNENHGMEEEDALLTGERTSKQSGGMAKSVRSRWREIGLFVWAVVATAAVILLAVAYQHGQTERNGGRGKGSTDTKNGKKNLIFMVSDGMGPSSLSLTRTWRQYTKNQPYNKTLVLDDLLVGQSRTRSTSSLITDSAAGATAFSCGLKTYNGAISVLDDFEPCGSVMEAAKRVGYTTGLVVTTSITDATPAVFVSHVRRRDMQDEIALQMTGETHPLGRMVDFMMGGGRCHFLPSSMSGGCRSDGLDVVQKIRENGWTYIDSKDEFDNLGEISNLPFMGLFASHDFPYEIDRQYQDDVYPSLEAMTRTALKALSAATKDSEQGFFVMIEGSRIDHAGHGNDPAAQVHEVLAYDQAMAAVLEFISNSETPTLMVSTSDHETGGLAVARQLHSTYPRYLWYPDVLANVSHSASHTAHEYYRHLNNVAESSSQEDTKKFLVDLVSQALGIQDCSNDELDVLLAEPRHASRAFADMVSRRAQTGWSTHGHSAADVNIYTSDPRAAIPLRGNRENTDVGAFLRSWLGVDAEVDAVTRELRAYSHADAADSWLGAIPQPDERLDGQDHLDHYAGEHRRGCDVCGATESS